jgi:hypothetical protein
MKSWVRFKSAVRQHPLDLVVCPVLTAFIHIDTSSAVHLHSSLQLGSPQPGGALTSNFSKTLRVFF